VEKRGESAVAVDGYGRIIAGPSTDHSAVIQAAINSLNGGGSIAFRTNTYNIASKIRIPQYADPIIIDGNGALFNLFSDFLDFDNGNLITRAVVRNLRIAMQDDGLTAINVFNYRSEFANIYAYPVTDGSTVINIKRLHDSVFSNVWGGVTSGTGYVIKYINTVQHSGEGASVFIDCGVTSYGTAKGYAAYLVGNPPDYYVQHLTFLHPYMHGSGSELYMSNYLVRIVLIDTEGTTLRIGGWHRGVTVLGGVINNIYIGTDDVGACSTEMPVILDGVLWASLTIGTARVQYRGCHDNVGTIGTPARGTCTIKAGNFSTAVYHELRETPTVVLVTPLAQPPGKIWVESITSQYFIVKTDVAPSSDLPIAWYAEV
jgi:hypothetical protein